MEHAREEGPSGAQEHPPAGVKKPYVAPALIDYGSVAKLTASGLGSGADGPVGFMMSMG
jgi:hypothetical protein